MTADTTSPRIYVACLAAYNAGRLHGRWIDAAQDADAIWAEVREMLAASPVPGAEEHAIHDYEGFAGIGIGEYDSIAEDAAWPAYCIDWERAARDLFMGDYWSTRSDGGIYVFRAS